MRCQVLRSCKVALAIAEIAGTKSYHHGDSLQTLRADIDYGFVESHTTYGRIGVKVWIYKGEVLPEAKIEKNRGKGRE